MPPRTYPVSCCRSVFLRRVGGKKEKSGPRVCAPPRSVASALRMTHNTNWSSQPSPPSTDHSAARAWVRHFEPSPSQAHRTSALCREVAARPRAHAPFPLITDAGWSLQRPDGLTRGGERPARWPFDWLSSHNKHICISSQPPSAPSLATRSQLVLNQRTFVFSRRAGGRKEELCVVRS